MSKKRTWHIEYDVSTGFDLTNAVLVGNRGLHLTDNSTTYPIPENLKITEITPPLEAGYYIGEGDSSLRMRTRNGTWFVWSLDSWVEAGWRDDLLSRNNKLRRLAPLGLEDD